MKFSPNVPWLLGLCLSTAGLWAVAGWHNGAFEYCTTEAYGLPFPWRINNCLCDGNGGLTEFPIWTSSLNALLGLVAAKLIALWFCWLQPTKIRKPEPPNSQSTLHRPVRPKTYGSRPR